MSSFPVKIIIDRTIAYYKHVPLIWELQTTTPYENCQVYEDYFKTWAAQVQDKVPVTKRDYCRKCIQVTNNNSYREWVIFRGGGAEEDPVSKRMLDDLEEAYHLDRAFLNEANARNDIRRQEWDGGFKEAIDPAPESPCVP